MQAYPSRPSRSRPIWPRSPAANPAGCRCGSCGRPAVRCPNTGRCANTTACWRRVSSREVACEITLQPIRRYGVDAAILFSDIVVPLRAAGIDLDIVADVGPVIADPVRTAADIDAMKPLDPASDSADLRGGFAVGRRAGRCPADRLRRGAVHAGVLPGRGRAEPQPCPHQGDDAGRTGELACADDQADRPHHRVPARPDRRRGGRDPAVRLVGGDAVAGRLPPVRAAAQLAGFR